MKRAIAIALIGFAGAAGAGDISLCDLCAGYRLVLINKTDLLIYCPNQASPWLTIPNCRNPRATKSGANLRVTCNA